MNYVPTRKWLIDKDVQCIIYYGVCGEGLEDDKYFESYFSKSIVCWDLYGER